MDDFRARIEAWLDTSKAEEHIEKLIKKLSGKKIKLDVDTGDTQKGVEYVDRQIKTTTKATQSFGDSLKKALNIGSAATLIAKGFHEITSAAGKAKEAVKDIDAAIMELRMATNDSYANTLKLVKGYNQLGQQIGATTTEVTDSANSFLRQGKSISETNELIRDSMILSKTANISAADATKYLTSAMKGYKVEAQDAIGIVDKLLATDLISATDAGGLAEGMSKTAVSANMAGVEMEKLIGYLAATGEVTQESMSIIGNSFKTFFARYSDIKSGKLQLIDEDGTTETLSDVEQSLKNVGISMRTVITDFDDYDDAIESLAAKWDTLNSTQQNAIAKAFGGTRQKERFLIFMENYDNAQKYAQAAADSAGIAEQKFSAYADSLEAKSKSLQAAFEALSMDIIPASAYGGVIEATTALVTFLDKTNLVKGSIAGLAAVGTIKLFSTLATGISNAAMQMDRFNSALSMAKSGNIGKAQLNQLIQLTQNLSQSQLKAVISCNTLTNEQRKAILTASGMSAAEADATLATMGLATAEGAATTTTFTLRGAIKGLWATLMANPLILVATGVASLVSVFASASQAAEEARQKAEENAAKLKESAQAATENRKSIENLIAEYKKLADASNGAWSVEDANQLKSIQEQITSLVGEQAGNLDLVNGKIEDEYQKLLNIYNLLSQKELSIAESEYLASKQMFEKGYQQTGKSWSNGYMGDSDNNAMRYVVKAYEQIINPGTDGTDWLATEYLGLSKGLGATGYAANMGLALEQIGSYEQGLKALYDWQKILNEASQADYFGDAFGNAYDTADALTYVTSKISEFETAIKAAQESKERFFSAKANNDVLDYLSKNNIKSQEDYNAWIADILDDKSISKDYAKSLITAMQSYFP
ncbi:MAG: phage tail tape measure protein [Agathobacter sp.]